MLIPSWMARRGPWCLVVVGAVIAKNLICACFERIDRLADRVARLAALRHTPVAERRCDCIVQLPTE